MFKFDIVNISLIRSTRFDVSDKKDGESNVSITFLTF